MFKAPASRPVAGTFYGLVAAYVSFVRLRIHHIKTDCSQSALMCQRYCVLERTAEHLCVATCPVQIRGKECQHLPLLTRRCVPVYEGVKRVVSSRIRQRLKSPWGVAPVRRGQSGSS